VVPSDSEDHVRLQWRVRQRADAFLLLGSSIMVISPSLVRFRIEDLIAFLKSLLAVALHDATPIAARSFEIVDRAQPAQDVIAASTSLIAAEVSACPTP
jgi:hypothetical protein